MHHSLMVMCNKYPDIRTFSFKSGMSNKYKIDAYSWQKGILNQTSIKKYKKHFVKPKKKEKLWKTNAWCLKMFFGDLLKGGKLGWQTKLNGFLTIS